MQALTFTLSGETAFFRQPDVNAYLYFTYGHIHKVALLGMFGAILGLDGYNQMKKGQKYPEFYEALKDLRISIRPLVNHGLFLKKIYSFNNSVGYASFEKGGNLIVTQQWLEKPSWDIALLLNDPRAHDIRLKIMNKESVYLPYLGSNAHPANIRNASVEDLSPVQRGVSDAQQYRIVSLVPQEDFTFDFDCFDEDEEFFQYREKLPVSLHEQTNLYQCKSFIFTNYFANNCHSDLFFQINNEYWGFY